MRVSLVGAQLSEPEKESLAKRLIGAFAEVEVGRDTPAVRSGFLVHFEQVAERDLFMGDRRMSDASGKAAVVTTQVMAGPWTPAMKAEVFRRIEEIVRDATDMPKSGAGADFWMTITEVPEGGWGLGGSPVSIGRLAPVFAEDRQRRIRAYLDESGGD
jgi:phenylpyruvate tautomerase PptA (4-oxalocrotonate tautomerase family)